MYNIRLKHPTGRIQNPEDFVDPAVYEYIISTLHSDSLSESYYIISPDRFFKDAGDHLAQMAKIDEYMPDNVLQKIKDGKCKLIIDLSYEANGLGSDKVQELENGKNSHIVDMYSKFNKFCLENDIVHKTKFITMMENPMSYIDKYFADTSLHVWSAPSIPMRYKQFNYDDYKHLLNVPGEEKNALWLNRRLRNHRINLIAAATDLDIDFEKFHFSFIGSKFEAYEEMDKERDYKIIKGAPLVNDENYDKVISHFGKMVGLDTTDKTSRDMDQWLGTSDIGRVIEMLKIRSNSAYEIVSEFTHNDIGVHFSEKFTLPILSKKPFLISGDKGILRRLQNLGFKTFDKFWPEHYDRIDNNDDRSNERSRCLAWTIRMIEDTFHNDVNYTRDEYGNVIYCDEMQEILEHNYKHYHEVYYPKLLSQWQEVFSGKVDFTPLIGKHPVQVEKEVSDNSIWEDTVWYNQERNHFFIPIWRNGNTFFMSRVAEKQGYRLVKNTDIENYKDVPAIAYIRNPYKRIAGQCWRAYENNGITEDILKKSDDWASLDMHFIPQVDFLKDYNVVAYIDLDNPRCRYMEEDIDQELINSINNLSSVLEDKNQRNELDRNFDSKFIGSKWFQDKYKKLYKEDFKLYFDTVDWKFKNHQKTKRIGTFINNFFDEKEHLHMIDELVKLTNPIHHRYLKSNTDNYWNSHSDMLDGIGMSLAPTDAKILDLGTHFGLFPYMLNQWGFKNVDSTNSSKESMDDQDLPNSWKKLGINTPYDLTVEIDKPFTLRQKYDIIFVFRTNLFWKLEDVFKYCNGRVFRDWQIEDTDGNTNTFFSPWELSQWKTFEKSIKNYLEPGGFAVVQPEPFVYNMFPDRWEKELEWFRERQQRGYTKLGTNHHYWQKELQDYFIITNDGDYT